MKHVPTERERYLMDVILRISAALDAAIEAEREARHALAKLSEKLWRDTPAEVQRDADGEVICAGCRRPFDRIGRQRLCDECRAARRKIANRDYMRRQARLKGINHAHRDQPSDRRADDPTRD